MEYREIFDKLQDAQHKLELMLCDHGTPRDVYQQEFNKTVLVILSSLRALKDYIPEPEEAPKIRCLGWVEVINIIPCEGSVTVLMKGSTVRKLDNSNSDVVASNWEKGDKGCLYIDITSLAYELHKPATIRSPWVDKNGVPKYKFNATEGTKEEHYDGGNEG